jgi:phosphatidate cytidylyltransferase
VKQRVLTAALLIPPVLLAVFLSDPVPLWLLALVAFGICYAELRRFTEIKRLTAPLLAWLGLVGWMVFLAPSSDGATSVSPAWAGPAAMLGLAMVGWVGCVAIAKGKRGYLVAEIAGLWIAAPFGSLLLLKLPFRTGDSFWQFDWTTPVLYCLIPLWIGDSLAIFAGRAFGKHPLAPKISPKKTIEGGVANLGGCILGAVGLSYLSHQPYLLGLLAGVATGILGQAGDLLESAMKRSANLKDSGTLLPGHGGLLDRIDSILLSAPVVALIVVAVGGYAH